MSNARTRKAQDQINENGHSKNENENNEEYEHEQNDNANDLMDSSDDFDKEEFQRRIDKRRKYKKKKYEENAEKIKQQYDPAKRREKYQKEKVAKQNIIRKIFDAQKNEKEEELDEDEDVTRFYNRQENESLYKKKWYKDNCQKIKKQYDPVKRAEKHLKEKVTRANRKEEIDNGDIDELDDDINFHKFMNKETKEKEKNKAWYKKNAERIKAKRKASYNRIQKLEENKRQKSKREKRDKIEADILIKEYEILGWPGWGGKKGLDVETRNDNLNSKKETLDHYYEQRKNMQLCVLDENSHVQIIALKLAIEEIFKKNENETCKVKKIALDFAKMAEVDIFEIQNIYKVLKLQHCESWYALKIRIDIELHEIAMSIGKSFSNHLGHNRRKLSKFQYHAMDSNQKKKFRTWHLLRVGLGKTKNLQLLQEQSHTLNDLKGQIHDQYIKIEDQIHKFCHSEEELKYEEWQYKYGVKKEKRMEFWSEMPLSKEIIEKWSKLEDKIIEEFKNICNHFGLAFDIEVEKDCLKKCHFCIVNKEIICIDSINLRGFRKS
jgi:hypothetical protein